MSQRERREKTAAHSSNDSDLDSLATKAALARMARLTGAGVSGLGASTMAFVVGGCLALGYFAGTWLDARYETTHWMPIGVFVGLAASVREMFRTLRHLNAQTQRDLEKRAVEKTRQSSTNNNNGAAQGVTMQHRVLNVARDTKARRDSGRDTEPEISRPRIFHVPPPPLASFDANFAEDNAEIVTNEVVTNEIGTHEIGTEKSEDELQRLVREVEKLEVETESEINKPKTNSV